MLALVVTIIVLLILAAITLNLAVGENGIIERAKLSRDKAKNASIKEEEAMNAAAGEIDNVGSGTGGDGGGTCPDTKPLEDRIKELESQVGALQQQLETEKANKAELENRITELNNQIAELNKQIEAGNTQIGELQAEITRLQNQLEASQAENERLRTQIAELNTQKAELEAEIARLQSQLEASQADNEKLRAQIEKLNTQKAELEAEITRLQNQLAAVQTENEKLQEQITNLNNQIGNLNTQIGEKNKTIETQKQTIANLQGQITEKDRLISQKNETIKTMQGTIDGLNTQIANLNNQINQLKAKQATGNVAVGDVLKGKTFSNSSGVGLIGTMANNGAISKTLNAGQSYTVPAGYHNGSGKVTAASLASQTSGTAGAGDILTGKTSWVNGNKVTGTMANRGAVNQKITGGGSYTIPAGYHNGSGKVNITHLIKTWTPNYGQWVSSNSMRTKDTYSVNATSLYVLVRAENGGSVDQYEAPQCSNGTVTLLVHNGNGILYQVNKTQDATFTLHVIINRNYSTHPNATLRIYAFTNN